MAALTDVDSNGVRQEVIDKMERFRLEQENDHLRNNNNRNRHVSLTFDMQVSQRDAEYIVECLRIIQNTISKEKSLGVLSLDHEGISDEAIDLFCRFLQTAPCHFQTLWLWKLPSQQVRRLLAALKINTSIKDLRICKLLDGEGATWIADLLRHKTDFTDIHFYYCRLPFTQMLPCLRGQLNLKSLSFDECSINSDTLLFNDPESTQLFVDSILLSPSTALKKLSLWSCGVSVENRPLMEGFHKNTTVVKLSSNSFRRFINPILRRNRYLGHVHDMLLGTRTITTLPAAAVAGIVVAPTIPPPCGLWPTVLAKVGQGTQGASPAFMILCDRLATWMTPSPRYEKRNELNHQQDVDQPNNACNGSLDYSEESLVQNMDGGMASPVAAAAAAAIDSESFQSSVYDCSNRKMTVGTTTRAMTVDPPSSSSATQTEAQQSPLHKKRTTSTTEKKVGSNCGKKRKN